jgi:hypothetical protein
MVKFGIKTDGYLKNDYSNFTAADVTAVFNAIHSHIQGAAQTGSGDRMKLGDIALGDYVNFRNFYLGGYVPNNVMDESSGERFLRVIVVGINPYKGINGNGNDNHLVFQFKYALANGVGGNPPSGIPSHMNDGDNSSVNGGYGGSVIRTYLKGTFYNGLVHTNTGIPASVIWAPNRIVGEHIDSDNNFVDPQTIADTVWLPTLWEVTGSNQVNGEDATYGEENGGRLNYYSNNDRRKKITISNTTTHWALASPIQQIPSGFWYFGFCTINSGGNPMPALAASIRIAPAFCVK